MTLLFGHVRRWRGGELEAAYAGLDGQRRELLRLGDELETAAQPTGWRGDAAEAAHHRLRSLTERMEQIVANQIFDGELPPTGGHPPTTDDRDRGSGGYNPGADGENHGTYDR